jgi:lysophospholipase L1-like esterase
MPSLKRLVAMLFALSLPLASARADFALKDGDRVVFYGDSITDQGLYTSFAETYVVTRFPNLKIGFTESGWSGDRVSGGGGGPIDVRLNRDVIPYKPTVMTIMLGMNDGGYRAFDQKLSDDYANGYRHILDVVKKSFPSIRFTMIQPSPYDDVTRAPNFEGGYNAVLLRYSDFVKSLADENHSLVSDFNEPVVADLQRAKDTDPNLAQKILPDRVHPSPGGHLIMAEALLKTWDAPAIVTDVEINAGESKVDQAVNAKVSDLKSDGSITWTQKDDALPMPVDMSDPIVALAINSSDFIAALDQEILKATGLKADRYQLKIDAKPVGTFTKDELTDGINLATKDTPMMDQAKHVEALTFQHNQLHKMRWRQIQVSGVSGDKNPGVEKSFNNLLKALDKEEAGIVADQRKAAQPKMHQYQLIPASG